MELNPRTWLKNLKPVLFVLFFMIIFSFSNVVQAEGNINLQVSPGFNGDFKANDWVPIQVTIKNDSEEDIEGNVIVEKEGYESSGTYYQPISVASHTIKQVTLLIPGQGLQTNSFVRLVDGSTELAKAKIGGRNFPSDTIFVGVLASDKDTANFLSTISMLNGNSIQVEPLDKDSLKGFSKSINGLDVLILNNFSSDSLSQEQIDAIKKWTENGGALILAGGAQYSKTVTPFTSILPVKIDGVVKVSSLSSIEKLFKKEISFKNQLTISEAKVLDGQTLFEEEGIPIIAVHDFKSGKVLYVAYDLAEEPLASWSGNKELWSSIFYELKVTPDINKNYGFNGDWWSIRNASERIPALKLPNLSTLVLFFIIYILIVGPISFFVLKKINRKELNWFIVPLLSIIIAISIYQISLNNRGKDVLAHNVSILEINDKQQGQLATVSALFVPKSGEYEVSIKDVNGVTTLDNNYRGNPGNVWISINSNQTDLKYKNVEFWSLRSFYINKTINDIGQFDTNLSYRDGKLSGTITNNTNLTLSDTKILIANNIYQDLGKLAPGDSVNVDVSYSINANFYRQSGYYLNFLLPKNAQNQRDTREFYLVQALNNQFMNTFNYNPTIIGWTEDSIIHPVVKGKDQEDYNLTLIKADLNIKPTSDGNVFYQPGYFEPKISFTSQASKVLDSMNDGFIVESGEIELEYDIQTSLSYSAEKIYFYLWSRDAGPQSFPFDKKIYNWEKEEYDSFSGHLVNDVLSGKNIDKYLKDGKIKIQLVNKLQHPLHLGKPAIAVEGKVMKK